MGPALSQITWEKNPFVLGREQAYGESRHELHILSIASIRQSTSPVFLRSVFSLVSNVEECMF